MPVPVRPTAADSAELRSLRFELLDERLLTRDLAEARGMWEALAVERGAELDRLYAAADLAAADPAAADPAGPLFVCDRDDAEVAPDAVVALLGQVPLLHEMPLHATRQLRVERIKAGGVIFQQGEEGAAFFFIAQGAASVTEEA